MSTRTVRTAACGIVLLGLTTSALLKAESRRSSHDQAAKRGVRMEITLPKDIKDTPIQIAAREGESGTIEIPDFGKFGFEPRFKEGANGVVVVAIFDAAVSPNKRLGQVEVPADGKQRLQSKTSPDFGIRIMGVIEPK